MAAKKNQAAAPKLSGRGGAGRGQGRKRTLRQKVGVTCSYVLTESERAQLLKRVAESGLSQSSYVRRALGFPAVSGGDVDEVE